MGQEAVPRAAVHVGPDAAAASGDEMVEVVVAAVAEEQEVGRADVEESVAAGVVEQEQERPSWFRQASHQSRRCLLRMTIDDQEEVVDVGAELAAAVVVEDVAVEEAPAGAVVGKAVVAVVVGQES